MSISVHSWFRPHGYGSSGCQFRRSQLGYSLIRSFGEDGQSFLQGLAGNRQWRRNFYRLAPGADGRKEQQAFLETEFHNSVRQIVPGFARAGDDRLQAADQTARGNVSDHLRVFTLNLFQASQKDGL